MELWHLQFFVAVAEEACSEGLPRFVKESTGE
jgi:hypothetical protein